MVGRIKMNETVIKICGLSLAFIVLLLLVFGGSSEGDRYKRSTDSDEIKYKQYVLDGSRLIKPPIVPEVIEEVNTDRVENVDFRLIVITFNRAHSLLRLLNSLNTVDYRNDTVALEIWIDRSKGGEIDDLTYTVAKRFKFMKGHKSVHCQPTHAGIYGQWIWTWQPKKDTKEIVSILEDDLSVSPVFYRYLKKVHAKYDHRPEVNGYALQGVNLKHGGGKGNLNAPWENIVFLYPVLGSWGFSPNARNWVGFQDWFREAHKNKTFMPLVPGILPSLWYKKEFKAGTHENIWTMWHIYYAYMKNERTLYPNFKDRKGFTINWRENGLHFSKAVKVADPLITEWDTRLQFLPEHPIHLDTDGKVVK